ncbi:unnamed protein product [Effrenium voratum]|uniref:Uncharacterized protein n=1 Tax=Effrenium voratum TaxID=2562239 RepID=A0AA36J2L0_9DINO|nr:unnamed protein product [Effrenium voratum]
MDWRHSLQLAHSRLEFHGSGASGASGWTETVGRFTAAICGRQWAGAVALLGRLRSVRRPPVAAANACAGACRRGGSWRRALQTLEEVRQRGLRETLVSTQAVLPLDWRSSLQMCRRMCESSLQLSLPAVSSCICSERWREAAFLLRSLKSRALRTDAVAGAAALHGAPWRRAAQNLRGLRQELVQLDVVAHTAALSAVWRRALAQSAEAEAALGAASPVTGTVVLAACAQVGLWQRCQGLIGALSAAQLRVQAAASNALVTAGEKASQWPWALGHLATDIVGCNAAVSACEKGLQWQRARQLLGSLHPRLQAETVTCAALVSACAATAQWREAFGSLGRGAQAGLRQNDFTSSGLLSAARRHWRRALLCLAQLRGTRPSVVTEDAAITACEKPMQWKKALHLYAALGGPSAVSRGAAARVCAGASAWQAASQLLGAQKSILAYVFALDANDMGGQCLEVVRLSEELSPVLLRRLAV